MGNYMYLEETDFSIPGEKEDALTRILRDKAIEIVEDENEDRAPEILRKVEETGRPIDTFTLDELFECWGWSLIRELEHKTDQVIDIKLDEDYSSTEEPFFALIAPYINAGSYITLSGSQYGENWEWRYGFTGKRVEQLFAEYPPVTVEE